MVQFSLQWSEYKQNFCDGLSSLQQNGDMVDVTLAADGHLVCVHRLVLSLASPYLKELLASASDCKHPVVFLNQVSFTALSLILEYIYTGQVVLSEEQLPDLLQTANALRIKGLEDMALGKVDASKEYSVSNPKVQLIENQVFQDPFKIKPRKGCKIGKYQPQAEITVHESATPDAEYTVTCKSLTKDHPSGSELAMDRDGNDNDTTHHFDDSTDHDLSVTDMDCSGAKKRKPNAVKKRNYSRIDTLPNLSTSQEQPSVQYTVSNAGTTLQMILNRYIYFVRYASKKGNGLKTWRCVNHLRFKCPALVVTKNDIVLKRSGVHNHEYHDKRILKKVQANLVYATPNSAIQHKQKIEKSISGNRLEKDK